MIASDSSFRFSQNSCPYIVSISVLAAMGPCACSQYSLCDGLQVMQQLAIDSSMGSYA